MNFIKLIRKSALFTDLSDREINTLFDCLKGRIVMKSKGMLVAKAEDEMTDACIVLDGSLLEFSTNMDGTREPIGTLSAGDCYGLYQGYLPDKKLGHYVVAINDVSLLYLDISSITTMCEKACPCHQKLICNVMSYLSCKISSLKENNSYITTKGMRQKIAKLVYDKYIEQKTMTVFLGIDRNEMAAYLNVSRPSMSREMMRMREDGIFDFWKDKITIKDVTALENILRGK